MISAEAPILFAKACELFIMDITFRALLHTNLHKRKTLQRSDIANTINSHEMFDFLIDIIPREETDKDLLSKRESEKTSLINYNRFQPRSICPLPADSGTFMRNPLYGGQTAQPQMRMPVKPMLNDTNFSEMNDADNLDNKSLAAWSLMGHMNRNKSSQQNPI
jgi:hypothetical protein